MVIKSRTGTIFGVFAAIVAATSLIATPAQAAVNAAEETNADATYTFDYNGESVELTEGASATFPIMAIPTAESATDEQSGGRVTRDTYVANCGVLTVTGSAGVFHYGIEMSCPATSFAGTFTIYDHTNGQSGGIVPVFWFSGDIATSKLRGHQYGGSLIGFASLAGVPVASVIQNYTLYRYEG